MVHFSLSQYALALYLFLSNFFFGIFDVIVAVFKLEGVMTSPKLKVLNQFIKYDT